MNVKPAKFATASGTGPLRLSGSEGNDNLLVLRGSDRADAALRAGDLVAATEAEATTIAVRCTSVCTVRDIETDQRRRTAKGTSHLSLARFGAVNPRRMHCWSAARKGTAPAPP